MATFIPHALKQMQKRSITKAEVQAVIDDPEITYPSSDAPDRTCCVKHVGARRIAAIVQTYPENPVVITAYVQNDTD